MSGRGQRKAKLAALRRMMKLKDRSSSSKETLSLVPKGRRNRHMKVRYLSLLGENLFGGTLPLKLFGDETSVRNSLYADSSAKVQAWNLQSDEPKVKEKHPTKPRSPRCVKLHPTALPSKAKLQEFLTLDSEADEDADTPKWTEGQMLWAKIRGYPYWPCMVSKDPFSKLFTRTNGPKKFSRSFHVQFFGVGTERSWVNEASLLEFEGREKFLDIVQFGLERPEKSCKSPSEFKISEVWYPAWSLAVVEAEGAFRLSVEERHLQYAFTYMLVKGEQQKPVDKLLKMIWKRSSDQSGITEDGGDDSDEDLYNDLFGEKRERPWYDSDDFYSSDDSFDVHGEKTRTPLKIRVRQGTFEVFYAKHAKYVRKEFPDWEEDQICQHLWQQWLLMSYVQRSRYVSRHQKPTCVEMTNYKRQNICLEETADLDPYKLGLEIVKLSHSVDLPVTDGDAEQICLVCEMSGQSLRLCEGRCGKPCHTSCVQHEDGGNFLCPGCKSGSHVCFLCKKADADTKQCSQQDCIRFYHEVCAGELPLTLWDRPGFVCPLHACQTCAVSGNAAVRKGPFSQCLQCPTAYHVRNSCIAAGCLSLNGKNLLCPAHFKPIKSQSLHKRVNVKRCFECGNVGDLLQCQSCPAAYHEDCSVGGTFKVQLIKRVCSYVTFNPNALKQGKPREPWLCADCVRGKRPLYGDILWIKLGFYRWWPGEVCHPLNVPKRVQDKTHQVGEFPVRFFGSQDFSWIHQGRVYPFDKGLRGSHDGCMTALDEDFVQGVKEATAAFRLCSTIREMGRQTQITEVEEIQEASFHQ